MVIDFKPMTPTVSPAPFYDQRTMFLSRDTLDGAILPKYAIVAVSPGISGYDAAVTTTCYLNVASARVAIEVVADESAQDANLFLMNEQLVNFGSVPLAPTGSAQTYVLNAGGGNLIQAIRIDGEKNVVILSVDWSIKAPQRLK